MQTRDSTRTATSRRLLRCDRCGGSVVCSHEQLMRYMSTGWPGCCGEVMAVFVEAGPQSADDTVLDRPSLPPG